MRALGFRLHCCPTAGDSLSILARLPAAFGGSRYTGSVKQATKLIAKVPVLGSDRRKYRGRGLRPTRLVSGCSLGLALGLLTLALPTLAQIQDPSAEPREASAAAQLPDPPLPGTISGTIVDKTGAPVVGARVELAANHEPANQTVQSSDSGDYSFVHVVPGPFQLTFSAPGFAPQNFSGTLHSGEQLNVPEILLKLATEITEVRVELSPIELAQEQIRDQEKQRVLGVFPNFYVSYVPNAAPLSPKQKFELAWKSTVDPVTFGLTAAIAGVQQAQNDFSGYGQGAQGYAKRFGASYADLLTSTYIGSAILPSLLKQDPRYFYKGTGSKRSRILYAIANSLICKGDNGHWQANYSAIAGGLASGGISYLYYPAEDRNGAALVFQNTLIGIGETAAANLLQEFLIRKLTPNVPGHGASTP